MHILCSNCTQTRISHSVDKYIRRMCGRSQQQFHRTPADRNNYKWMHDVQQSMKIFPTASFSSSHFIFPFVFIPLPRCSTHSIGISAPISVIWTRKLAKTISRMEKIPWQRIPYAQWIFSVSPHTVLRSGVGCVQICVPTHCVGSTKQTEWMCYIYKLWLPRASEWIARHASRLFAPLNPCEQCAYIGSRSCTRRTRTHFNSTVSALVRGYNLRANPILSTIPSDEKNCVEWAERALTSQRKWCRINSSIKIHEKKTLECSSTIDERSLYNFPHIFCKFICDSTAMCGVGGRECVWNHSEIVGEHTIE